MRMVPDKGGHIEMSRLISRGFALPTVILALVILAVLITGAIYMAQQEFRVGWSTDQASVAFNLTERSVDEVLTNWDASTYGALTPWSSADTAGTLPDGTWSSTVTKMTDFLYYVDVTGVVSRGGALRAGASHRIGVIVHMSSANLYPPAALATRGSISIRGNAEVHGEDTDPPLWSTCTGQLQDKPGVAIDPASTVGTQGQGIVTGSPSIWQDPSINDDTFTEFGDLAWNDLIQMADIRAPTGSLNVAPSFSGDGTCNTGDTENWGDPETPGSACEDYFPIIFVNGDANIQANGSGQGILLVAGDLDIRGRFSFYGLIIVQGYLETQGNGNRVYGAVMAGNATLGGEIVTGGSEVQYSSCAVNRAILNSSLVRARRLPFRSWVDVSYLTY